MRGLPATGIAMKPHARPPAGELSDRQLDMMCVICAHQELYQRPPTYREIAAAMHITSINAISCHVSALIKKGALERQPGARGLLVSARGHEYLRGRS